MKHNTFLIAAIIAVVLAVVMTGCGGGSKSHTVRTPWDGTVAGVDTLPSDGESNVAVTTWIEVFWPDYYFAPSQTFTFRLQKYDYNTRDWTAVRTVAKDSDPDNGDWWFAPENNLEYDWDYRIIIEDDLRNTHTHYFSTQVARRAQGETDTSAKTYKPAGGGIQGGVAAEKHVIKVQSK